MAERLRDPDPKIRAEVWVYLISQDAAGDRVFMDDTGFMAKVHEIATTSSGEEQRNIIGLLGKYQKPESIPHLAQILRSLEGVESSDNVAMSVQALTTVSLSAICTNPKNQNLLSINQRETCCLDSARFLASPPYCL